MSMFAAASCVATLSCLLSSCGSSGSPNRSNSSTDAAIIAGWKAALNAFDMAARTSDPNSPGLLATHAEPELGIVQRNLALAHAHGEVAIGLDRVMNVKVLSINEKIARLKACVDDGEVFIDRATNKAVPGPLGQTALERSYATMVLTRTGWKLEQQSVSEGRCS
jgi:hypothetical protein